MMVPPKEIGSDTPLKETILKSPPTSARPLVLLIQLKPTAERDDRFYLFLTKRCLHRTFYGLEAHIDRAR